MRLFCHAHIAICLVNAIITLSITRMITAPFVQLRKRNHGAYVCTLCMHTNVGHIGPGTYVYIYTCKYGAQWPQDILYRVCACILAYMREQSVNDRILNVYCTHVLN